MHNPNKPPGRIATVIFWALGIAVFISIFVVIAAICYYAAMTVITIWPYLLLLASVGFALYVLTKRY
jgi:hypothetical protein